MNKRCHITTPNHIHARAAHNGGGNREKQKSSATDLALVAGLHNGPFLKPYVDRILRGRGLDPDLVPPDVREEVVTDIEDAEWLELNQKR